MSNKSIMEQTEYTCTTCGQTAYKCACVKDTPPGEPCAQCGRSDGDHDYQCKHWINVVPRTGECEPPHGMRLLAKVRSQYNGCVYHCIAAYYGPGELPLNIDYGWFPGCTEDDSGEIFCPEGWYECPWSDSYEYKESIVGEVVSWQELPDEGRVAGECEHEWINSMAGEPYDYVCRHCPGTRTVADFWREEPPKNIEDGDYYGAIGGEGQAIITDWSWLSWETRMPRLCWHGPIETLNRRIKPPPVPENES